MSFARTTTTHSADHENTRLTHSLTDSPRALRGWSDSNNTLTQSDAYRAAANE